ncbi:ABC transporter permease [Paracraurococcus lichenis]|uniref:ABC transporter permease n=1 Tax=Paracraurococcus lichenis TaxID=3064888 RepID=A0ABT9E914_9PROT|nr:ABC transporter permease [Paracraurococcus sp. LOR1-02]MDO9712651.1 ABC transporter permease [Paracraurococcus sp. LOR1-02]
MSGAVTRPARRRGALGVLARNRVAQAGAFIILSTLLLILAAVLFSPYDPNDKDYMAILQPPSFEHPFGTDSFGQDVLTRVAHGAQVSLLVSIAGLVMGGLAGTVLGMTAGYRGGWLDAVIVRIVELLYSFPTYVLALCLMLLLGYGATSVALAIGLVYVPNFARLARSMTAQARAENYVVAARLMGQSAPRILAREILPNIAAPLLVQFSAGLGFGIIMEAGLSFVGLGVQPPTPSLGVMMADGKDYFQNGPWVLTLTGLSVAWIILGLNLLGDGLRDALDPRLRNR